MLEVKGLFFLGIILQDSSLYLLGFFLVLAFLGLIAVLYTQIVTPFIKLKISEVEYPPVKGDVYEFIYNEAERVSFFTIGASQGNIVTKCSAISEEHLIFQFKKDPRSEQYDITIKRNGQVLFKPPRMAIFAKMGGTEKLESHELIGKTAEFRISDKLHKERMIEFIEISLTANFFFTKSGSERMKFQFTITKIHPGFNLKVKNRKGLFPFGKDIEQEGKPEAPEQEED